MKVARAVIGTEEVCGSRRIGLAGTNSIPWGAMGSVYGLVLGRLYIMTSYSDIRLAPVWAHDTPYTVYSIFSSR